MNPRTVSSCVFLLLLITSSLASARPYNGDIFTFTQPDNSQFEVRIYGDEYYAVIETLDGYTVTKDPDTGFYCYAELSADATAFISTGYPPEKKRSRNLILQKNIRLSPRVLAQKRKAARTKFGVDVKGNLLPSLRLRMRPQDFGYDRWNQGVETEARSMKTAPGAIYSAPPANPTTGTRVGLVLLARFPDRPDDVTMAQSQVDAYANEPDYSDFGNATSVYGYFNIQSNGKLQYHCIVTAYFTAAHNREYYTDNSIAYGTQAKELINEGLGALKAKGFDFSKVDANGDKVLDGVNLFYAGNLANNWSEGLWPHKWSSSWSGLTKEGMGTHFQYQISNIGSSLTLGTFCHENGHMICGFPDLYAYDGNAATVNNYSLMCQTGTVHPVSIDAYLKIQAGWSTVMDITASNHQRGAIQVDKNTFYRYRNPSKPSEYFILSMRTDTGYEGPYGGSDSAVNPANGLVIWHAFEEGANTRSSIYTQNNPSADYTMPYELMVVEAKPSKEITPWYDKPTPGSDDAYHKGDISEASDITTPALKFWDTTTGRTTASGLHIHSVGPQGSAMTFALGSEPLAPDPEIGLTASVFEPSCDIGMNPASQAFTVYNRGAGTLSYTITENISWLSLDVISGTATTEADLITLRYNTAHLADGTYEGTLTVTNEDSPNTSQTIHVVLTVNPPATVAISTPTLTKSLSSGMSATDSFTVTNSGGGTLHYTLFESAPWLSLGRTTGTVVAEEDEIQVTCDASNLFDGTYSAEIVVGDSSAGSPSQVIDVTLHVSGNITVHRPMGSETLQQGNRHKISWMTDGWVTGEIKIDLYKGGVLDSTIASSHANNGFYSWRIPESQPIGTDYRIRITSVDDALITGESLSDVRIGALPTLAGIPYREDFEADLGQWIQSVDDDFNWKQQSGGTTSSGTGPTAAQSGTSYIYTDSSSHKYPGKFARLENTFDLRDAAAPLLSFYYHMYGSSMGTLVIRASVDQTHWTPLFCRTGDQGNHWQTAKADLASFAGQVVMIQIIGTTGSRLSDMALDDIRIEEASKALVCDTRLFTEKSADDGSISNKITFALSGDTFTSQVVSGGHVTARNVPSGLTATFVRDSATRITLTLTGNAINHKNKDGIFDLQVIFADGSFAAGDASAMAGSSQDLRIDYVEIMPPNSDPTITGLPTDLTVLQGTTTNLDLSPAFFSDADSGERSINLRLSAGSGALSATRSGDVVVTGTGTGTVVLQGTSAAIDTFLNTAGNIRYTGAADVSGNDADAISLIANDGGHSGLGGGTDVELGTVNIDIKALHLLSITKVGIGLGRVTSEPTGIDCGNECSHEFPEGTTITLTAKAADAFSWFTGWSGGGCFGTGDCIVNLTDATAVTAIFEAADRDDDGIPDALDAFPDDKNYNHDGDNDGMPSLWETRNGFNPAIDDAALDSDGDGLSNLKEFIKGTDPHIVTNGPGMATMEAPDNFASEQPLTLTLKAGYAITASADLHARTCWQIAEDFEFTSNVFKTTSPTFKTQVTVPQGILDAEKTYYWRVQYIDTDNTAWVWSEPRSFTTRPAATSDDNANGIPDHQEVSSDSGQDLDGDTFDDLTQVDMHCLALKDSGDQISLKDGDHVYAVDFISQMDAITIEEQMGRPVDLPAGLFNFRIVADQPGAVVTTTMYFSKPLPDNIVWYKYDSLNGWHDYSDHSTISDDRKSVVIELKDGDYGDADGIANGIVVDPSGPGSTMRNSNNDNSGGCFIDTAFM